MCGVMVCSRGNPGDMKPEPGSRGVKGPYLRCGDVCAEAPMAGTKRTPRRGERASRIGERWLEELEPRGLLSVTLPLMPQEVWPASGAESTVAADFDGDGLTDLVSARLNRIVFFKGNADGTFVRPPILTILPARVGILAVGRFNGDQRPDLASIAPVASTIPGAEPIGLLVRAMYFDPATGHFSVGARLRIGGPSAAAAQAHIGVGNFLDGWRDEIVVGIGPTTDIRLLNLPDRYTLVQKTVLLSSPVHLIEFAIGDDLPYRAAGRPVVLSLVKETYSSTLLATTSFGGGGHATRPVQSFSGNTATSLALGDVDGDGMRDVVLGGTQVTLLRAASDAAFALPVALNIDESGGERRVDAVADVDDDGRADIVLMGISYQTYRFVTNITLQPLIARQRSDGTFSAIAFGYSQTESLGDRVGDTRTISSTTLSRAGTQNRAALVQTFSWSGVYVSVMTDELFAPYAGVPQLTYDVGSGGSVLRTGSVRAFAWDWDPFRGGHVVRVEFIVDLNHSGMLDPMDPVLAVATVVGVDNSWSASFTMPGWAPGMYSLWAVAYDNDGLMSWSYAFNLQVYP